MKKSNYFLILLYTFFVLFIIFHYIFNIFDFTWQELFNDLELLQSFVFFVVIIGLSLTILIVIAARLIQYLSVAQSSAFAGWTETGADRPARAGSLSASDREKAAPSDRKSPKV